MHFDSLYEKKNLMEDYEKNKFPPASSPAPHSPGRAKRGAPASPQWLWSCRGRNRTPRDCPEQ